MESKYSITPFKRLVRLLQVDRQEIYSIYLYALFNGVVTLSLPLGIQAIINLISAGQTSTSWIILVIIVIGGVAITGVLQIAQVSISENIQRKIFTRSAFEFAFRIPRMKLEVLSRTYTPELVNRFFDTLTVQKGLSKILIDFSSASLQILFGLILLSLYHQFFIIYSLALLLIVYLIFRFTTPQGIRTSLKESKHKYEVAHWLEEIARALETFKLAGQSPLPLRRTDELVSEYLNARKAHFKTLLVQFANLVGFKVIIAAGLLLIGGLLVINDQMNIGQFVASEIIIILVLANVEKLILSMETIYDVLTAIEKIGNITDIPLEKDEGDKLDQIQESGMSVKLSNFSLKFDEKDENTLDHLNFKINAGEKVCLAGFNGSGKSSLIHALAGLYNQWQGTLLFNNIPFRNWQKENIRSMIGSNLPREDVFKGSLLENISLGRENVGIEEVQQAAAVVGLTSFVEKLPEGYNSMLVAEGKDLPRSLRIKIQLARSIASGPKLMLLEEGFNILHEEDRDRFLDFILTRDWTVLAVTNDPDVAGRFERIVVLDEGKIIANDSLENLKKESWYPNLFKQSSHVKR
jgi:ABC-type bacteriocin/lantibiotic exporter with double-glycine peptidase domain